MVLIRFIFALFNVVVVVFLIDRMVMINREPVPQSEKTNCYRGRSIVDPGTDGDVLSEFLPHISVFYNLSCRDFFAALSYEANRVATE